MKKLYNKTWTEAENLLLLEYYHTLSKVALSAIFPDKDLLSIDKQAAYLNRKNRVFNYKR